MNVNWSQCWAKKEKKCVDMSGCTLKAKKSSFFKKTNNFIIL